MCSHLCALKNSWVGGCHRFLYADILKDTATLFDPQRRNTNKQTNVAPYLRGLLLKRRLEQETAGERRTLSVVVFLSGHTPFFPNPKTPKPHFE